ncbi:NRDE-2, necessary for RNA interference domain-containing protein [Neurospora intermedia]|uniref:NRDE-2, necessary for RNA interference domain-containing protein n=1 Tax=Neurospora intermedia TaxID=5142 RepID=A0ABR3DNS2_NEUIN
MSSNEVKRRAVPKFTSFAPATPAPKADPEKRSSTLRGSSRDREKKEDRERRHRRRDYDRDRHKDDSDSERERERERGRDTDRHQARQHDRHHSRHHDRDRHHRRRSASPASQFKELHKPSSTSQNTDLFYFDKSEDALIFRYGGNERSKIPSYRRFGAGKLIGSPGYLSVSFQDSKEVFTIRGPGEGRGNGSVFGDKTLMAWARAKGAKVKHIKPGVGGENGESAAEDGDFISLEPPRKRQRADRSPAPEDGDKTPDYRSIYGKAKSEDEDSDGDETLSDPESENKVGSHLSDMSTANKRSLELHRQVKNSPQDTKAWLELIGLQDTLFMEHQLEGQVIIGDQVKALAELKLSLYEEALPHALDISLKETLLNGMMREGEKVWDPKQLAKRWEEITKSNSDSFLLWVSRLNYELSQVATFTYDELKTFMVTKLQILHRTLATASSEKNVVMLCSQLIYVFVRLTCYLRDSGYIELAVAAWQATLELNFCRPRNASNFQSAIEDFSDFWESEVPRIGEGNAKGWRHSVEDVGAMTDPPEAIPREPSGPPQARDPFEAWASLERREAAKARMPARTLDEGTDDDPFRIVMFSDIKDLVLWIPSQMLPQVQLQLVDAFLIFCRLPNTAKSSALKDPFIAPRGQAFESLLDQIGRHDILNSVEIERKPPLFGQQGGNMALSQELLFSGQDWFQYLGQWASLSIDADGDVRPPWVLETLHYLVLTYGIEQLAEYYLALAWLSEPLGAKKVAKGLLRRYSSNTRLYNAYAMIEFANGNIGIAEKVLLSATSQSSPDSQLLWNTWVWMHLNAGNMQRALLRLLSSVDITLDVEKGLPVSPALLLKARAHFSTKRDYSLSSHQTEPALQYAESLALLDYLSRAENSSGSTKYSSQGNITSALANIQSFTTELSSLGHQTLHERLLQIGARLLYHHADHGPYKPSTLRQYLHEFLRLFPHNTLFLSLLAWAEQSTLRINDPVRSIVRESLSSARDKDTSSSEDSHTPVPIPTYRFAIEYELLSGAGLRPVGAATIHSTKAAFEAAVSDPSACRYNVDIWIGYIRFLTQVYFHALSVSYGASATAGTRERGIKKADAQAASTLKALKDVFYRAVAACPWSKKLYMAAFSAGSTAEPGEPGVGGGSALVKALSSGELRAVFGTMVAKGLRVHVDFEGFERKWREKEEDEKRVVREKEKVEKEEKEVLERRARLERQRRWDLEDSLHRNHHMGPDRGERGGGRYEKYNDRERSREWDRRREGGREGGDR